MTVNEIRARVEAIRALAWDDEAAHGREDELRADVLRAIAEGAPDAAALAAAALETGAIEFARWCA